MTLCEKCIHGDVCGDRDGYDEGNERALTFCSEFKSKDEVVEVVRCKDCKYWKGAKKPDPITNYHYGDCTHEEWQDAEGWDKTTCGHEFCSRGERKEQG